MIYFTKYADNKFDILNNYKIFYTREQIEDIVKTPEKISRKGKYFSSQKNNIKVIYLKEKDLIKIITFYPVQK